MNLKKIARTAIALTTLVAGASLFPANAGELPVKKPGSMSEPRKVRVSLAEIAKNKELHPLATRGESNVIPSPSPKQAHAASRSGSIPQIWGSVIYSDKIATRDAWPGLYELPKEEGPTTMLFKGPDANAGGVYVDGKYYSTTTYSYLGSTIMEVECYDVETGTLLSTIEPKNYSILAPGGLATDPTSGIVYGITYNSSLTGYQLSKMTYSPTAVSAEAIAPLDGEWNAMAFDASGQLYAISYEGYYFDEEQYVVNASYLNKIDKTTGAVTLISETGSSPQYFSSAVIDDANNRMIWNLCPYNGNGYIYEVDLTSGNARYLYQLEDNDEIMGMFIAPPLAEPGAPGECTDISIEFPGGALVGKVSLRTPATLYDGITPGSGTLDVKVLIDGVEAGSVSGSGWNTPVEIPINLSSKGPGMYDFIIYATGEGGKGASTKLRNVWVGADTPESTIATLQYTNGYMVVTWNPVLSSVNGGYLDIPHLTYTVKRHDGSIAAEGLASTSFMERVDVPVGKTSFYYTVEAVCNGLVSEPAKTNVITMGNIIPPVAFDFATDGLTDWTIIDANKDGKEWLLDGNNVVMSFNISKPMDDWLITPALVLKGGKRYDFSLKASALSANHPERFEVKAGKTATVAGMTTPMLEPTTVDWTEPRLETCSFTPDEDGLYYIGIHGISDADKFKLILGDIRITDGIASGAPEGVSDLTVVPDVNGKLKAEISFKAPTKTITGGSLSSIDKIEVTRGGEVVKQFDNVAPGSTINFTDNMTSGGNITWGVIACNADGAGPVVSASAFVGCHKPIAPESANMVRTSVPGEVLVTWPAVTEDIYGNTLTADNVTYGICIWIVNDWYPFLEGISATSATFQAVPAGSQDFVQFAVCAETSGGRGKVAVTPTIAVGTPYEGLYESFADGELHCAWGIQEISEGTAQQCTDTTYSDVVSQDADNGFVSIEGAGEDSGAALVTGLINLADMNDPILSFYVFNSNGDNNNVVFAGIMPDGEKYWASILEDDITVKCNDNPGWNRISVSLAQYAGKVVQLRIGALTANYYTTLLDNIYVGSWLPENGLPAPSGLQASQEGQTVTLTWNAPELSDTNYTLTGYNVYRNGVRINSGAVTATTYSDYAPAGMTSCYVVTAIYEGEGESGASNEASVSISAVGSVGENGTAISVEGNEIVVGDVSGRTVTIVTADGKTIFRSTGEPEVRVSVAKGIYMVYAEGTARKVAVR